MARSLVNEQITAPELTLCDERGVEIAIVPRAEALAVASARGCDLVQDDAASSPPRCRLVGRATGAGATRATSRARGGPPKEIRIATAMGGHDVATRARQAKGLLERGYSVKLSARLTRGERSNPVVSRTLLERIAADMSDVGRVERKPFGESGALSLLLAPIET